MGDEPLTSHPAASHNSTLLPLTHQHILESDRGLCSGVVRVRGWTGVCLVVVVEGR